MPPSISVAMIVRDEGENLGECLASIQSIADEICIVDTGSRDNTLEIARQFRAKVSVFIWCDDFSAARNESLRLSTGDWVFVIDADERVAPGDLARIRALANGPTDWCYRFTTRNYTNTASVADFHPCPPSDALAQGFAGWYPSNKVRFFPNGRGGRFEGKVHELVNQSLERNGVRIGNCDVFIHHYPLLKSPEHVRQKQQMYLQLGHDKVAANPTDPKGYLELGNQYAEVGDHERAAASYREALRLDPANPFALRDLGGMLHTLRRGDEARRALRLALQLDPSMASAWRNLGVVYADAKEWEAAVECFERGLALDPTWMEGLRYLSVALEGAGRAAEAATASRKALEAMPASLECLRLYIHQMLRLEKRPEARDFLLQLIQGGTHTPDLHNALGELFFYDNLYAESKGHFNEAATRGSVAAYNNLGVVLFRERRFEDAKEAFEKCISADPGHRGARSNLEKVLRHIKVPEAGPEA